MASQAVILAAGKGSRLGVAAQGKPKPLVDVGGQSLIQRQIRNLQKNGVTDFLVVTGFAEAEVQTAVLEVAPNTRFVTNPEFATTNTLHSLYLAMPALLAGDFYYLNADVLFAPTLLKYLQAEGNRLAIECKLCGEEEVKVIIRPESDRIIAISKKLEVLSCLGEFIGIAKFTEAFKTPFYEVLKSEVALGHGNDYFEKALHLLSKDEYLQAVDITGEVVIEVDFPEDLAKARRLAELI